VKPTLPRTRVSRLLPRRGLAALLGAAGLSACGYPEEDTFAEQLPTEMCAWVADCALDPSPPAACEAEVTDAIAEAQADEGCAYHPDEAAGCLEALAAGCDERVAVYYECKRSWRGGDCAVDLASALAPGEGR
jgi:hypothetical protein